MQFAVKGGGRQFFPLFPEVRSLLENLPRAEELKSAAFVFTYRDRRRKGHPLTRIHPAAGSLWEDFRTALAEAEIQECRFHDLRHTFATRMLRRSQNLKLV